MSWYPADKMHIINWRFQIYNLFINNTNWNLLFTKSIFYFPCQQKHIKLFVPSFHFQHSHKWNVSLLPQIRIIGFKALKSVKLNKCLQNRSYFIYNSFDGITHVVLFESVKYINLYNLCVFIRQIYKTKCRCKPK